tara:strand:+ start:12632 stop:13267 length:636 start_codon:yes stop_codon:yes gene_type:complete
MPKTKQSFPKNHKNHKNQSKKKKVKVFLYELLPLPQEMIFEIMRYLPNQWVMYDKRKDKPLSKGTCIQMENIEYRKHRCIYDIPPQPTNIGKILYCGKKDNEHNYVVQFLKKRQPVYYTKYFTFEGWHWPRAVKQTYPYQVSREQCHHCKDIHLGSYLGSPYVSSRDRFKCNNYYLANSGEYTLTHKEIRPLYCSNKRQIQMTKKGYIKDV